MEDKQKIYLDKVVELLIKYTEIDYRTNEIKFPFDESIFSYDHYFFNINDLSSTFSKYVTNTYGLTMDEDDYVWDTYKDIILDKIENGR